MEHNRAAKLIAMSIVVMLSAIQSVTAQTTLTVIPATPIKIGFTKTTNLIFPYKIISADKGSNDILIQKAKGVDNILQLKAAKIDFQQTNLTVITSAGDLYSFLLDYGADSLPLNIRFEKKQAPDDKLIQLDSSYNDAGLEKTASDIKNQKPFLHLKKNSQKMQLAIKGIYLADSLMWLVFDLRSRSLVPYHLQSMHLTVKDKHLAKRTAYQETPIAPVFKIIPNSIDGDQHEKIIIACKPFTISNKKQLIVLVDEDNGERDMLLKIRPQVILKAKLLVPHN